MFNNQNGNDLNSLLSALFSQRKAKEGAAKKSPSAKPNRTRRVLLIVLLIVLIASALFAALNSFYVDILWFSEVGYLQVFFKEMLTKLTLFVPLFLALTVLLTFYFKALGKIRSNGEAKVVDAETGEAKRGFFRKRGSMLLGAVVSLIVSSSITGNLWYKILEFKNAQPFGEVDPIFGKDISFYMFKLPFLQGIVSELGLFLVLLAIATLVYSVFVIVGKNDLRAKIIEGDDVDSAWVKGNMSQILSAFRVQFAVFAACALVLFAINLLLQRYGMLQVNAELFKGASYTDVNVRMPLYFVLAAMAVLTAVLVVYAARKKKLKPLVLGVAAYAAVALLGFGYSWVVEGYVVAPNQYAKEQEYIEYSIEATRAAFGLDDIEVKNVTLGNNLDIEAIKENETTISNIPINDYNPTIDTFNSLQGMRPYYEFHDVDVDRYYLDGDYREVFISAREMNTEKLAESARNWINEHLKYTHGMGVAVSLVNEVNSTGQPVLSVKDIPTTTPYEELTLSQERLYFGEVVDDYAVVNTLGKEFDYPSGENNAENVYDGDAGIPMSFINRVAFAIRYGTAKFLFSSDITGESKILLRRNVVERVAAIAPFFAYDDDPYIVAADGRLYWIIDGLTTSGRYPYATEYGDTGINYVRNSVKVVIDAYNGDVTFYLMDEDDPIAQVCSQIYPKLFASADSMPESIRQHIRYPEALFNVQADMYTNYHMTNPGVFYNKEDVWQPATQFYETSKSVEINSTYLIMKLPDAESEEFILMMPFTPQGKDNMIAWMAGKCDGENYGKLVVYQFSKQSLVYGPMQIEQRIDQDTAISPQLTLLSQQGSAVLRGNMQAILVGDDILYVEVVYVQASGGEQSLPEVKKVIVSYKDKITMGSTLMEGIENIFGSYDEPEAPPSTETGEDLTDKTISELVVRSHELYALAQSAIGGGDWAKYGEYMQELGSVLDKLYELQNAALVQ